MVSTCTPVSQRTTGSTLFVNPLMAIYFIVDLDKRDARCLYLDRNEVFVRIPRAYPH